MTRRETYNRIYEVTKEVFILNPHILREAGEYNEKLTVEDNASRRANICAVQQTEEVYQWLLALNGDKK